MRLPEMTTVILALAVAPSCAGAAGPTLLLALQVNGYATGKIGEFSLLDGALAARRGELRDLGFRVPEAAPSTPGASSDGLVALSSLSGMSWRLDEASQTLYVTSDDEQLLPTLLGVSGQNASALPVESSTGATLNYDVSTSTVRGQSSANGELDLRVFSPRGIASSGLLAYAGSGSASPVRLDSTYTYSDADTLRRYRVGDFVTGSLNWTRAVRLGGVQIETDFAMRPDLITFPLPSLAGSAAVPSTVDVLVNGNRTISQQVGMGPFAISQLPVVTGAGTISMTLTNALGQQVTETLPFYASATLLEPGLQNFSIQAGAVRRNWGTVSNDYGSFAATATYRRGLSSTVTVEASAEGAAQLFMGGAGIVASIGNFAVFNAAAAVSTSAAGTGSQFSIGIQRQDRVFGFGASVTVASTNFVDVAALNGSPTPRLELIASTGASLGRLGSVGLAYAGIDLNATPGPVRVYVPAGTVLNGDSTSQGGVVSFQPARRSHILSASYTAPIRDVSLYLTGYHDFTASNSSGVMIGLTIPLGKRSSVSASAGSGSGSSYAQVQAQQSPVTIGDWGYQVYGSRATDADHEFAQVRYKSPWTMLSAGVDRTAQDTLLRLETQGAISVVGGGVFASNTINDSFGIVDTGGVGRVRVLDENLDAGRTDSSGRLLVPDLRSYAVNHLAIDPADLPPDVSLDSATRNVRPQDRSAVVVKFAVRASRGALVRLVDEAGAPVAPGSVVTLRATRSKAPVGYDGDTYIEGLDAHNEVGVEQPGGQRCTATFDYQPAPGDIPTIGPVVCHEQTR
ncbi:fimbria/pilus outer membrane usher protein [Paraburkholderia edwinii]|uniref:Fimbria/pilus outer membrane usher protein n=1 Tax=Paraburkholderia edwinii TaxID=2861782 RepID=A0ABX8UEZ0_9BURK|nr:fimbria/pilus outer membrane usher protein [Paraburkholderia edwinii]QYD67173.1 fimbria/pilus outer membrane usher protein [Paraburkholderia edwinii]